MEWNRVKSILIVLLLAANIILGANIAMQVISVSSLERESLQNVCKLLAQRGIKFDKNVFEDMPKKMVQYSGIRSVAAEKKMAETLLGQCQSEEAGGGITKYYSSAGKAIFRSGGLFEFEIFSYSGTEEELIALSGLKIEQNGYDYVLKTNGGLPVINATLNVDINDGNAKIYGQWIFSDDLKNAAQSAPRSEIALVILSAVEEQTASEIVTITPVYYVQEERASGLSLIPVWQVDFDNGIMYINTITKKPISF